MSAAVVSLSPMPETPFPALPDDLPPGRVVRARPSRGRGPARPVLWLSDAPQTDAGPWWAHSYAERDKTGLYPLLLETLTSPYAGAPDRPWRDTDDLVHQPVAEIDELDANEVLRKWWDHDGELSDDLDEDRLPLPRPWPGLAAATSPQMDPDAHAAEVATEIAIDKPLLIGLVPAARGADALTAVGWQGPANHTNHTREISAVVRSWEERFGARVVTVGFATLGLSVAAAPTTFEHARAVAVEHHAFCPDNVNQGGGLIDEYARELIGAGMWWFWWD